MRRTLHTHAGKDPATTGRGGLGSLAVLSMHDLVADPIRRQFAEMFGLAGVPVAVGETPDRACNA
jgi:sugar (pentulose or hexulose) kinase